MRSVEDYCRQWETRERGDMNTLSIWIKDVRTLIQVIIKKLEQVNEHKSEPKYWKTTVIPPGNICCFCREGPLQDRICMYYIAFTVKDLFLDIDN